VGRNDKNAHEREKKLSRGLAKRSESALVLGQLTVARAENRKGNQTVYGMSLEGRDPEGQKGPNSHREEI